MQQVLVYGRAKSANESQFKLGFQLITRNQEPSKAILEQEPGELNQKQNFL